jgi:protein-tyrosine phosphatase
MPRSVSSPMALEPHEFRPRLVPFKKAIFEISKMFSAPRPVPLTMASSPSPSSVLFLCLGNICRSPTAEAVFKATVEKKGASARYTIDSCGTGGGANGWYKPGGFSYHEGEAADSRMTTTAAKRGVRLTSRSRPLRPDDITLYDTICCMDEANVRAVRTAVDYWVQTGMIDARQAETCRVVKMTNFLQSRELAGKFDEVPDPYYSGQAGFELVLDLLEDACEGLVR